MPFSYAEARDRVLQLFPEKSISVACNYNTKSGCQVSIYTYGYKKVLFSINANTINDLVVKVSTVLITGMIDVYSDI